MGESKHVVDCACDFSGGSPQCTVSWQEQVRPRVCIQKRHMWHGGDICNLSVHLVGLLQGSNPLCELHSFSSCLFTGGELGDGGKSGTGQPNHICITKEVTHMCAHLFCGLWPMKEGVKKKTQTARGCCAHPAETHY